MSYAVVFVLVCVVELLMVWVAQVAEEMYRNASEDKQRELLYVYAFVGKRFWKTPLVVSRALMGMFSVFERKPFGLCFAGVQCIFRDKSNRYLVGKRQGESADSWLYDVGAAGMISIQDSPYEAMCRENHEELTYGGPVWFVQCVTPADGFSCIIYVYEAIVNDEQLAKLKSTDGTYERIDMYSMQELIELINNSDYHTPTKKDTLPLLTTIFD